MKASIIATYLLIYIFGTQYLFAKQIVPRVAKLDFYEFKISAKTTVQNPFTDATLKGTFTSPGGKTTTINGFYDGDDLWKLRFAPTEIGTWLYELTGLGIDIKSKGKLICVKNKLEGFIGIHPQSPYAFAYRSGQPFFPMGDTSYGLYDDSPITPELQSAYLDKRRKAEFNFVRMEAGHSFSRAQKDNAYWAWGGSAFHPDLDRFNPVFFKGLDRLLLQMRAKGMNAELILLNFYRPPFTNIKIWTAKRERLWLSYLVARYAAFSNIFMWTVSNEYETHPDGIYRLDNPADIKWAVETAAFLKANDPYKHLVTVHSVIPSSDNPWRIGGFFGNEKAIDLLSQQTGQSGEGTKWDKTYGCWTGDDVNLGKSIAADRIYNKPVVNTESGYEHLSGFPNMKKQVHSTDKVRRSAWRIVVSGGYFAAGFNGTLAHSDIWNQIDWPNKYTFSLKDEGAPNQLSILYQFFHTLCYWKMEPFAGVSDNAIALHDGALYIAYLPHGGTVTFKEAILGKIKVQWINPRSGKYFTAKNIGNRSFTAPDANDWVLKIEKR